MHDSQPTAAEAGMYLADGEAVVAACVDGHPADADERFCRRCGQPVSVQSAILGVRRAVDLPPAPPVSYPHATTRAHGGRGLLIALGVAIAVAGIGVGATVGLVLPRTHKTAVSTAATPLAAAAPTAPAPATPPPSTPAQALPTDNRGSVAAAAIDSMVAHSATARPLATNAVAAAASCSISPTTAETQLDQAIRIRQDVVSSLQSLDTSGLPNGNQLVLLLSRSMQDSVNADRAYEAWMTDPLVQPCVGTPSSNANYNAATSASSQATADKQAFVASWNLVATPFGLHQYQASDL
jgi:hypothetical protein